MHPAGHLLVWAVLGLLLFAAERALAPAEPVAMDTARAAAAARMAGFAPDARTVAAFAAAARDEELLARAAERSGLARGDAIVRDLLAQRMRFLAGEDPEADAGLAAARALGLEARDPAVRRHLALRAAAQIRAEALAGPADEAALRAWFEARREQWRQPETVRVAQLFFAGADALARAASASARLEGAGPDDVHGLGDPHLLGAELPALDEAQLSSRFGAAFARAAFAAPDGTWIGPIASSHGAHLIYVRERRSGRVPDFSEVRAAVEMAWRAERAEAAFAVALERLRTAAAEPRG